MNSVINMQNETQALVTSTARRLKASSKLMGVAAVTALSAMAAQAVPSTLYDSAGFEGFADGDVVTQFGWTTYAVGGGGNSTANVITNAALSADGNKALQIDRSGLDPDDSITAFYPALPATHQRYVFVEYDLRADDVNGETAFGPGFGLEVYATGNNRIASFGIDAGDGSLYVDPGTGIEFYDEGLQRGVYQNWFVTLDFLLEEYTVEVNGIEVLSNPFNNDIDFGAGDYLTDASFGTFNTDDGFADVVGTAYLDNYIITDNSVPEPGSIAILGIAGAGLLARRRR